MTGRRTPPGPQPAPGLAAKRRVQGDPRGPGGPPHNRGVTLVELLVSITLLSLLSVGMLMTLRVGLNSMDKANSKLMANRRVASVERIVRSEIENLIPVSALCVPESEQPPETIMYFQGRIESMRFVSAYSLQEAAPPASGPLPIRTRPPSCRCSGLSR